MALLHTDPIVTFCNLQEDSYIIFKNFLFVDD